MEREKNTKQIILTTLVVVGGVFSAGGARVAEDRTVQHGVTAGIADFTEGNSRCIGEVISGLEDLLAKANQSAGADPELVEAINRKLTHLIQDLIEGSTAETHEEKQPTTALEKFNELMLSTSKTVAPNGQSVLKMIKCLYELGAFLPQIPFIVPYGVKVEDYEIKENLFEQLISLMPHDISDDTFQAFKEKVDKDRTREHSKLNLVCIINYISTLQDSLKNEKNTSRELNKFFENLVTSLETFTNKYIGVHDQYNNTRNRYIATDYRELQSVQKTLQSLVADLCLKAYSILEAIHRENLQLRLNIPGELIAYVMDTIHSNLELYQDRTVVKDYIVKNPDFAFKTSDPVPQQASMRLTGDNLDIHNRTSIPRP